MARLLPAPLLDVVRRQQSRHVGAVADVPAGVLEREGGTPDLVGQVRGQPLEQRERLEGGDPLRRRRQLDDFVAAIAGRERLDPGGAVRGEVLLLEPARCADRRGSTEHLP